MGFFIQADFKVSRYGFVIVGKIDSVHSFCLLKRQAWRQVQRVQSGIGAGAKKRIAGKKSRGPPQMNLRLWLFKKQSILKNLLNRFFQSYNKMKISKERNFSTLQPPVGTCERQSSEIICMMKK
jgi:hypothetical protein